MSVQAVSWVLDHSKSRGFARLVLIALANHADRETGECYPAMRTIAREAGISLGAVSDQVTKLVELGELVVIESGGPRRSARYQLTFVQELNITDDLRSAPERSAPERSVQPRSARSVQPRGEQNRHITVRGGDDSSDTSTPPTPLPAERWARRWCEIRGVTPTRSVLRSWVPKVQDFINAGGEPTEDLLQAAASAGIESPGGWGFIGAEIADRDAGRRASEWMAER